MLKVKQQLSFFLQSSCGQASGDGVSFGLRDTVQIAPLTAAESEFSKSLGQPMTWTGIFPILNTHSGGGAEGESELADGA